MRRTTRLSRQNRIYSVVKVLIARHFVARVPLVKESVEVADLVFVHQNILQRLKPLLCKELMNCYLSVQSQPLRPRGSLSSLSRERDGYSRSQVIS